MAHGFDRDYGPVNLVVHAPGSENSRTASDLEMVSVTDLKNLSSYSNHDPSQMPYGGSCILDPHKPAHLGPTFAHSEHSGNGVLLNRRTPSPEDYHNFILYHGSQKVYEATFIQRFLAHALHSNQLDHCLPPNDENRKHVHQYLKCVLDNVNRLHRKMVYNTKSRIVKFMASDGKDTTPFWDCDQFDSRVFAEFTPSKPFSVVETMNQSWHKAFQPPSMIPIREADYSAGLNISPFEEIDNVTERTTLFTMDGITSTTPHHPDLCEPRNTELRRGDFSDATVHGMSRRFSHGIPPQRSGPYDSDERSGDTRHITEEPPLESCNNNQNAVLLGPDLDTYSESLESERNTIADADNFFEEHIQSEHNIDDDAARSESETLLSVEEHTHLENLVQSDVPSRQSHSSTPLEKTPSIANGKDWRTRLIEDHKRRLAEKWPNARRPQRSLNFGVCVKQAIAQGRLKLSKAGEQVDPDSATSPSPAIQDRSSPGNYQCVRQSIEPKDHSGHGHNLQAEPAYPASPPHPLSGRSQDTLERPTRSPSIVPPRKRQKTMKQKPTALISDTQFLSNHTSSALSPSGALNRLETLTEIPPQAYFKKKTEDEQPAWRCGISHCMGAYYNSGDRKNCVGCFSSVKIDVNPKRKVMDFYLPPRSFWFHASPEQPWKVSKSSGKDRSSSSISHNSIGKDAYWSAISEGATSDEAWQKGIEAVETYLQAAAMKKEKKEPALKPAPVSEPMDLDPHPSGSVVMEHGQTLPKEASFRKLTRERNENKAWRCDVNHAFGRYYMAGDVKSCPGCGSSSKGFGKHFELDFFLPPETVVQQKAPDLVKWKPRKAYKLAKKSQREKQHVSHNQIASKKYWELVDQGHEHVEGSYAAETLELAIKATEQHILAKLEASRVKLEMDLSKNEEASRHMNKFEVGRDERQDVDHQELHPSNQKKRSREELESEELHGVVECEIGSGTERPNIDVASLDDESTSSSDSD